MVSLKLRWLGNAGFALNFDGSRLLVDPFLTRPHWWQVYFGRCQPDEAAIMAHAGACGFVLVTHTHFDHFMDVPIIAKQNGAIVCGSHNTCDLAFRLGVPRTHVKQISAGEEFEWRGVRVKAIKASHPLIPGYGKGRLSKKLNEPLRLSDYRMDSCLSFLIQAGGTRVLVWSSTGTAGAEGVDVLICRAVAKESWYKRLLEQVRPRLVIPSHWDDMFRPLSEPVRPFWAPPTFELPPLRHINLKEFGGKIGRASANCEVFAPERFSEYEIGVAKHVLAPEPDLI